MRALTHRLLAAALRCLSASRRGLGAALLAEAAAAGGAWIRRQVAPAR
jgi:hypothetical protein